MKSIPMTAVAVSTALILAAHGSAAFAGASCAKAPEIRTAFEPRLDYEHERALRIAGADARWPATIREDFDEIESAGLDCRAVYDRYNAFVDEVITQNDRLEENSPKSRGLIFRKW